MIFVEILAILGWGIVILFSIILSLYLDARKKMLAQLSSNAMRETHQRLSVLRYAQTITETVVLTRLNADEMREQRDSFPNELWIVRWSLFHNNRVVHRYVSERMYNERERQIMEYAQRGPSNVVPTQHVASINPVRRNQRGLNNPRFPQQDNRPVPDNDMPPLRDVQD